MTTATVTIDLTNASLWSEMHFSWMTLVSFIGLCLIAYMGLKLKEKLDFKGGLKKPKVFSGEKDTENTKV